jgi:ATP-binding cassette subfamily B protein
MAPLLLLGNILTMVSRAEASAERVWEVLDTEPVVQVTDIPLALETLRGEVVFNNVSFRYDGGDDPFQGDGQNRKRGAGGRHVLNDISFSVAPGQQVALLGSTGSGKSTLVNLIPRFYDASSGHITIDGIDVHRWDLDSLRRHIGVVLQQTTLFSGTIRQNIAYGRPDASLDEVTAAAIAAQAQDFILAMPGGYDSLVEERKANLSGGQKQRIAIARTLLIAPTILILDDSTSAVDMDTEVKIQIALETLMQHRTTFIIAQRIQSVMNADQIIILENGRIAAQGTHRELLISSPIYQEIVNSQLGTGHTRTKTAV